MMTPQPPFAAAIRRTTWGLFLVRLVLTRNVTNHVTGSNQSRFGKLVLVGHMICDVSGLNQAPQNRPLFRTSLSCPAGAGFLWFGLASCSTRRCSGPSMLINGVGKRNLNGINVYLR